MIAFRSAGFFSFLFDFYQISLYQGKLIACPKP